MENIKPSLPMSASRLIRQFVVEDDIHSINDLEGFQVKELLAEISYDKACFAYTCEFGCLDQLVSDLLAGQYNHAKAFNMIEELYIETWIDSINAEINDIRGAMAGYEEELKSFNSSIYRNMNDGWVAKYDSKHGE
jgi:hypothetical protein